nr:3-methyl-2-oxobutanoate hydroxymethyltransferase [Planctomycetota bacterium]
GQELARTLSIPVIGIGAGPHTDGQILVTPDLLGLFTRFRPRFVRRYAELGKTIGDAIASYCRDVQNGQFPGPDESYQ